MIESNSWMSLCDISESHTANEEPVRIQYKCLVPNYVFTDMELLFPKLYIRWQLYIFYTYQILAASTSTSLPPLIHASLLPSTSHSPVSEVILSLWAKTSPSLSQLFLIQIFNDDICVGLLLLISPCPPPPQWEELRRRSTSVCLAD